MLRGMPHELITPRKGFATNVACELALPMNSLVLRKVRGFTECLAADRAFERLFAGMLAHVHG